MQLSIVEIWDMVLSEPYKATSGSVSRTVQLTKMESRPLRLVPTEVYRTASELLANNGDSLTLIAEFVQNCFFYYRECVNREPEIGAPHVFAQKAYEWPKPIYFQWGDVEAVNTYARLLNPVHLRSEVALIRENEDKIQIALPLRGEEQTRQATKFDRPERELKFEIPEMTLLGFVDPTEWQIMCLRTYANELGSLNEHLQSGNIESSMAYARLTSILARLSEPLSFPVSQPIFNG